MSYPEFEIKRSGFCIFADDIRTEATGKEIFVGVYDKDMLVPNFPVRLDNLVMRAKLIMPVNDPIKSLKVFVQIPGESEPLVFEQETVGLSAKTPGKDKTRYEATVLMRISPLELKESGIIRVWAETEREKIFLGSLKVESKKSTVLSSQMLIAALAYYRDIAQDLRPMEKEDLSMEIIEFFVSNMGATLRTRQDHEHMIIPLGGNRFKIFFRRPLKKGKPLPEIKALPISLSTEIVSKNQYGAVVQFSPEDIEVEGININ